MRKHKIFIALVEILIAIAVVALVAFLELHATPLPVAVDPCDVNADGSINVLDLQLIVDWVLNGPPSTAHCDLNADGQCNTPDVQIEVDAVLGFPCRAVVQPQWFDYWGCKGSNCLSFLAQAPFLCQSSRIDPRYRPEVMKEPASGGGYIVIGRFVSLDRRLGLGRPVDGVLPPIQPRNCLYNARQFPLP